MRLKEEIDKYERLRTNSLSSDKELERRISENKSLKEEVTSLKKKLQDANSRTVSVPKPKEDPNAIMNLRN